MSPLALLLHNTENETYTNFSTSSLSNQWLSFTLRIKSLAKLGDSSKRKKLPKTNTINQPTNQPTNQPNFVWFLKGFLACCFHGLSFWLPSSSRLSSRHTVPAVPFAWGLLGRKWNSWGASCWSFRESCLFTNRFWTKLRIFWCTPIKNTKIIHVQ